jgi:hypothetical protein
MAILADLYLEERKVFRLGYGALAANNRPSRNLVNPGKFLDPATPCSQDGCPGDTELQNWRCRRGIRTQARFERAVYDSI